MWTQQMHMARGYCNLLPCENIFGITLECAVQKIVLFFHLDFMYSYYTVLSWRSGLELWNVLTVLVGTLQCTIISVRVVLYRQLCKVCVCVRLYIHTRWVRIAAQEIYFYKKITKTSNRYQMQLVSIRCLCNIIYIYKKYKGFKHLCKFCHSHYFLP